MTARSTDMADSPTIYDYGFDKNLNRNQDQIGNQLVYDPLKDSINLSSLYSGTSLDPTNQQIKTVLATRSIGAGNNYQTIVHGLGKKPRYIKITAFFNDGTTTNSSWSIGTYDGTNTKLIYSGDIDNVGFGSSTSLIVAIYETVTTESQTAVVNLIDKTNLVLQWTISADGPDSSGDIQLFCEFFA